MTTGNSIQYAEELGGIAASDAMRIFHKIDHWGDVLLSCHDGEIKIPLNPRISLEEAEKALSESEDSEVNSLGQIRNYYRNVIKSYKARTTKGKSLAFLLLILFGYVAGILSKFLNPEFNFATKWYVVFFYILNFIMVATDVGLYYRNYLLDKKAGIK
jgi:hypothetical protein